MGRSAKLRKARAMARAAKKTETDRSFPCAAVILPVVVCGQPIGLQLYVHPTDDIEEALLCAADCNPAGIDCMANIDRDQYAFILNDYQDYLEHRRQILSARL